MPATGCSNRLQASYAKRGEAVNGGRLKPCNQQGKQGRMVRLADVARAAGVSTSTASRALSSGQACPHSPRWSPRGCGCGSPWG
ncbi:LacI family DNA-binding transcriptional regulator [Streptomyces sp. NPDC094472]|uniref:LacI family DNA-binding transcriptional regulator n=1 Tax=Streptomyces sp. NPDC094472 TaxID=3155080 RepID=UPI003319FF86